MHKKFYIAMKKAKAMQSISAVFVTLRGKLNERGFTVYNISISLIVIFVLVYILIYMGVFFMQPSTFICQKHFQFFRKHPYPYLCEDCLNIPPLQCMVWLWFSM